MGKKRKHSETATVANGNKHEGAPERPKRTLLGWKDDSIDENKETNSGVSFRNKEKVLVTCSRRISFRFISSAFILYNLTRIQFVDVVDLR